MHALFDERRGVLVFPTLFPHVDGKAAMAIALKAHVLSRSRRDQPAHKRLDARRVRITAAMRQGHWSLSVAIRGANHFYGVRHALNLINELILVLHERYPEYLIEHFGMSTE